MKRSAPWLTVLLQMVILLTVVACASPWLDAEERSLPTPRRSDDIALRGQNVRPIYNGSVVPGGVYSHDELRAAMSRDPVVADHYRGAKPDEMHAVTLTSGRAAYVSYRRGDRVQWTRERVWLNAGETLLTDGTTTIRARCGNCVSDVKHVDVAAVDPAHGELDDFVVPPTLDTSVDPRVAAAEAELGDLLHVPFAPESFALLLPGGAPLVPDLLDDGVAGDGLPVFGAPPIVLPGGVPPGLGVPPDVPAPSPPAGFVPPDDGTTTGGPGTGTPGGVTGVPGATTGGAPDATTTSGTAAATTSGLPVDTSSSASTGTATGSPTTDSGVPATGLVTDGTVFPTTVGVTTASGGTADVPEPGALWLVSAGLIGLARRRLGRR